MLNCAEEAEYCSRLQFGTYPLILVKVEGKIIFKSEGMLDRSKLATALETVANPNPKPQPQPQPVA
jgi:hypothetical protein